MANSSTFKTWEQAVEWLRSQPDKQQLVHDAYYDDPLINTATRYWKSEEWQEIKQYLPTHKGKALDIGAGRGIASFALAKEGFQVTALEPNTSSIVGSNAIRELAQQSNLLINVVEELSEALPFPDNSFDVIFARAVLHHTKDLEAACKEFHRVLSPNGILIAVREHVISSPNDLKEFLNIHPLHNLYGGENAFLLNYYIDSIKNSGFQLINVLKPFETPINFFPYSIEKLKIEVINKINEKTLFPKPLLTKIMTTNTGWFLFKKIATRLDNRPGRLYSFIAKRT